MAFTSAILAMPHTLGPPRNDHGQDSFKLDFIGRCWEISGRTRLRWNFLSKPFWNTFRTISLHTLIDLSRSLLHRCQSLAARTSKTVWCTHFPLGRVVFLLSLLQLDPFGGWRVVGGKHKGSNRGSVVILISISCYLCGCEGKLKLFNLVDKHQFLKPFNNI